MPDSPTFGEGVFSEVRLTEEEPELLTSTLAAS
jgi:hypothetical protein